MERPAYGRMNDDEAAFDPRLVWRMLRRRAGVFVGALSTALLVLTSAVFLTAPEYTAETVVVVDRAQVYEDAARLIDGAGLSARDLNNQQQFDTQIELFRDPAVAARVVRRLEEETDAEALFSDASPALMQKVSAAVTARLEALRRFAVRRGLIVDDAAGPISVTANRIRMVRRGLSFEQVRKTSVLRIRFTHHSPTHAATIANAFTEEYVAHQFESRARALRQAGAWIEQQLEELRKELRASEELATEFETATELSKAQGGIETLRERIEQTTALLAEAHALHADLKAQYGAAARLRAEGASPGAIPTALRSPTLEDLIEQADEVERRYTEITIRYHEGHPDAVEARQESERLEKRIAVEIGYIVDRIAAEISIVENRIERLEATLQSLQRDIAELRPVEFDLKELGRVSAATRNRYDTLLSRQQKLRERETLLEPNVRIVSLAEPSSVPKSIQKRKLLAAGGLFAFVFAAAAMRVADAFDTRLTNSQGLRRLTKNYAPVVMMPRINFLGDKRGGDVDIDALSKHLGGDRNSPVANALREIDVFVASRERKSEASPVVAFAHGATATKDDPKVAYAYAIQKALANLDVLYIDYANREAVRLSRGVETGEVRGDAKRFLPSALRPPRAALAVGAFAPPDLTRASHRGDVLGDTLGGGDDGVDLIVVSLSAIYRAIEPALISARSDATFFVAEWRKTTRDEAAAAVQRLQQSGGGVDAFVMANVDFEKRYFFEPDEPAAYVGR